MVQTLNCDRCGSLIPETVKGRLRIVTGNTEKMKFDLCDPCQQQLTKNVLTFLSTLDETEQKTIVEHSHKWPKRQ